MAKNKANQVQANDSDNKIVAYLRTSTSEQNLGIEAQRQAIASFAAANNLEIIAVFEEHESGKKNDRIELAKALALSKVTNACLVIAKLDRLSRNASFLLSLFDAKANFKALDLPDLNFMNLGIFALLAQQERELISTRTKAALQVLKSQGVKLGQDAFPDSARVARGRQISEAARENEDNKRAADCIRKLRSEGKTIRAIAMWLNEANVKTQNGKKHSATSVHRLMKMFDVK